jgi:hypothetical protein
MNSIVGRQGTVPGAVATMEPVRDQLFCSSLSDVPIGPSNARDDSAGDAPDEIAALEQRARDSLAALQAHLGSLTLPDIGPVPNIRSAERPFDRNDYIRLVRRGRRPAPDLSQALASAGSWLLSGLAVAPLGLLLAGLEPGDRVGDPVLLEAVHIFDEPAAAFLGSIAEASETTLTAAPAPADPLAVRAAKPDDRSVIAGARPEAAVSAASAAPVARTADESGPTVAPALADLPTARAVAPDGMSPIEMARPETGVLLALAGRVASVAAHSYATIAPAIAGSIAAQLIAPDRPNAVGTARPEPVVSHAVGTAVAEAAEESRGTMPPELTRSIAAPSVVPDAGTAKANARVEPARSLASPAPAATAVDAAAVLEGSAPARSVEPDRSNSTKGAPALPALAAIVPQTATREELKPSVRLALVSPPLARELTPDRAITGSARPEPVAGASTHLAVGLVRDPHPTVTPARVGSAAARAIPPDRAITPGGARPAPVAGASTRLVGLVPDPHPTVTPARVDSVAARAIPPDADSRVDSMQPKLAISPDFPNARTTARESRLVFPVKLEHRIALAAEPTVSPLSSMAIVDRQAATARPWMDKIISVSDVVEVPALASFDGPIGDHERLIAIASRGRDAVAGPALGGGAVPVAEEPKLTHGPDDATRDPGLKLAARSAPTANVDAEPAGTPVTMRADLTWPRLLAEEVALPPELVLSQGETTIRLASGLSSASLQPGIYEAVIEWGGAELPIAPLIVGNEPVDIAFRIEPSTVTLRFEGVAEDRVSWTIKRSEGGTLRLRGPVVSESLPPGNYTIEAEVDGEFHRQPLKVGVGEALTIVAR